MHHRTTPAARRSLPFGLVAACLALTACAGEEGNPVPVETPAPTTAAPQTQAPTQQTEAPATTEEPAAQTQAPASGTDEDTAEDTAVSTGGAGERVGSDDEVAAPGTEAEVGDTVTTHVQALEEGDEYYGYATLASTVVSVEQGDPSLFEQAENAEDFAGYVPWFVRAEHEWLTYEGKPNAVMLPNLVAFNSDGGEVSPVLSSTWSAGVPGCDLEMPDEPGVGEMASDCDVFAVPEGESIGAVGWRGDDYADGNGSASDNPYYDDPVLWKVP